MNMAVYLRNTSGGTLEGFSLGYTGEQWRVINNDTALTLNVQYQIFDNAAADIDAASGWTSLNSLAFTSPILSSSGSSALDGNASANREVFAPLDVTGVTWAANEELVLRWTATGTGTNRQLLAINDVNFAIIPEPSSLLLVLVTALAGIVVLRRRRG